MKCVKRFYVNLAAAVIVKHSYLETLAVEETSDAPVQVADENAMVDETARPSA